MFYEMYYVCYAFYERLHVLDFDVFFQFRILTKVYNILKEFARVCYGVDFL